MYIKESENCQMKLTDIGEIVRKSFYVLLAMQFACIETNDQMASASEIYKYIKKIPRHPIDITFEECQEILIAATVSTFLSYNGYYDDCKYTYRKFGAPLPNVNYSLPRC